MQREAGLLEGVFSREEGSPTPSALQEPPARLSRAGCPPAVWRCPRPRRPDQCCHPGPQAGVGEGRGRTWAISGPDRTDPQPYPQFQAPYPQLPQRPPGSRPPISIALGRPVEPSGLGTLWAPLPTPSQGRSRPPRPEPGLPSRFPGSQNPLPAAWPGIPGPAASPPEAQPPGGPSRPEARPSASHFPAFRGTLEAPYTSSSAGPSCLPLQPPRLTATSPYSASPPLSPGQF